MRGWKRTLALILALVLINAATFAVVEENQRHGVYPIDGYSISIPIISTFLFSAFVLPLLVLIGLLPGTQFLVRLCSRGLPWRICIGLVLLALFIVVALLALDGARYWAIPNHYSVAASYL